MAPCLRNQNLLRGNGHPTGKCLSFTLDWVAPRITPKGSRRPTSAYIARNLAHVPQVFDGSARHL